ncbi:FAD/NAD(P)-binding domain-containing protein [Stipitochalara longipes BDJ]|nr:FAD/NAD(P)-binding domain-containing protein [Stipitochalara longipes BDJ]
MESSSSPPLSIAIIGAGIAGITLAIALSEHNPTLSLTIYESRREFSEVSAGVGFGPNALKAMALISPKLVAAYDKVKTPNKWPEKDHLWYDFRWADTGKLLMQVESEKGFAHCNASRVHLLASFVDLVPRTVKVEFGKRVIDVQDFDVGLSEGTGKTRIRFEDGTDAFADAVVGCDGIRSACRRILLGENEESARAVYSGKYAYRKVVEMKKAVKAVGPEVENRQMYLGHGRHVLTFAIRGGQMLNVVAFKDGGGVPWKQRQWVVPGSREALMKDFAGCGDTASKILELIDEPEKWALFDHLPAPTYAKGNFCILGDAAHASTPHLGSGAGCAIEDVHLLSGLLTPSLINSASDIKYAFLAYDTLRRPRSQELVRKSREQGHMLELESNVPSLADGNQDAWQEYLEREMDVNPRWVWNADLESMLVQAKDVFEISRQNGECAIDI